MEISETLKTLIDLAMVEDLPSGDITTENLISPEDSSEALVTAKEDLVICGLEVVREVFRKIDPSLKITFLAADGDFVRKNIHVMRITGLTAGILKAERMALNFLQRLSGIATGTRLYVRKVEKYGVRILDTRKTIPGWRVLEKMAVKCGGGVNHRMSLSDSILIKDNHLSVQGSITRAVKKIRETVPEGLPVEVEAKTPEEASEAADCGVDIILLDNMSVKDIKKAKDNIAGRATVELSGGINLENVEIFAKTRPDYISVGALTHSARACDLSLNIVREWRE